MRFDDVPMIPSTTLFRAAQVSPTRGNAVISKLREQGDVASEPTPTGRVILTPREGQRVFEALRVR